MKKAISLLALALIFGLTVFFSPQPSAAKKMARAEMVAVNNVSNGGNCGMIETANFNISFNSTEKDLTQVKSLLEKKMTEVGAIAKEAGAAKVDIQSSNYSVNSNTNNNSGNCNAKPEEVSFQFYGNINFTVEPGDAAAAIMQALASKGYQAGLNVNSYKQCQ